jgi:small subunit ribosomal protein S5
MAKQEKRERRGGDRERERERNAEPELIEKLVGINRVAKVVKGGKRFGFAAIVVVGDQKGKVGHGTGKAREVPEAIRKATDQAKRHMVRIPLREGRTLHHDQKGRFGAGRVVVRAAPPGTGIIAGGPMRAIFECLGVHDVVAKSVGTSNPHNMIKATFDALQHIQSPREIAARRGRKVSEIIGRRGQPEAKEAKE